MGNDLKMDSYWKVLVRNIRTGFFGKLRACEGRIFVQAPWTGNLMWYGGQAGLGRESALCSGRFIGGGVLSHFCGLWKLYPKCSLPNCSQWIAASFPSPAGSLLPHPLGLEWRCMEHPPGRAESKTTSTMCAEPVSHEFLPLHFLGLYCLNSGYLYFLLGLLQSTFHMARGMMILKGTLGFLQKLSGVSKLFWCWQAFVNYSFAICPLCKYSTIQSFHHVQTTAYFCLVQSIFPSRNTSWPSFKLQSTGLVSPP